MPARRPASTSLIVSLAAVGAVVAGAAGTAAYFAVGQYLENRTVANGPDDPGAPTTTTPPSTTPAAEPCPDFTIAAVKESGRPGNLTTVIYVKGRLDGQDSAEAWICRDSDGELYYQGHELIGGPPTAATSRYTVLLGGDVAGEVTVEGTTYRAYTDKNPGYHYEVSPGTFAKVQANGRRSDYEVVEVRP